MLRGVKNFSVGICDGAPSTAHSGFFLSAFHHNFVQSSHKIKETSNYYLKEAV